MALEQMGLGAILSFSVRKFEASVGQAKRAFSSLKGSAEVAKVGIGSLGSQLSQAQNKFLKTSRATGKFGASFIKGGEGVKKLGLMISSFVTKIGQVKRAFVSLRAPAEVAKTGIGGLGRPLSQAQRGFLRAARAAREFKKATGQFGASFKKGGEGVEKFGMAMLPVAAGMGFGVVKAAQYEQQISGLRAVMGDLGQKEFAELEGKARELGITSVFSATQSAEAMENMGRMGFTQKEILAGVAPILDTAAVANIGLAESANLVGGATRAMGLDVKEAARVADVMTVASQKSATTVPEMAEAMSYGASSALKWGMDLEETTAVLGKLADRMHKGSTGGMLLMNMINSLVDPTTEAKKQLEEWGVKLTDAHGKMRPLMEVVDQIRGKLDQYTDDAKRAELESVIFPQRASRAFAALSAAGSKSVDELREALDKSLGAAQKAAKTRLDNILGAIKLFGSSLESLSISIFAPFLDSGKRAFQGITDSLNDVLFAMDEYSKQLDDGKTKLEAQAWAQMKFGAAAAETAAGIGSAKDNIKAAIKIIGDAIKNVGSIFGASNKKTIEWVTTAIFLAAAVAPVALAIKGVTLALTGLTWMFAPVVSGLGMVAAGFKFAFVTNVGQAGVMLRGFTSSKLIPFIGTLKTMGTQLLLVSSLITTVGIGALVAFGVALVASKRDGQSWGNYWIELADNVAKFWHDTFTRMGGYIKAFMQKVKEGIAVYAKSRGQEVSPEFKVDAKRDYIKEAEERINARKSAIRKVPEPELRRAGLMSAEVEAKGAFNVQEETKKASTAAADAAKQAAGAAQQAADAAKRTADKDPCAKVNLDGREVGRSVSKAQEDINARDGRSTHWQRRRVLEHGAVPVGV
jgi:TP901 family phage tail tape measure protein